MSSPEILRTVPDIRVTAAALPRPLGLVPTMGALHGGHLRLVRESVRADASTIASLFVNPIQFTSPAAADAYPRDEDADLALLARERIDAVFVPTVAELYPPGFVTRVSLDGPPATGLEAAARPGHFDGVATIVLKLLDIVRPDRLYMGRKDAQQLAVVRRLVLDLDLPVDVVPVPTVREPDGLAMSSRNRLLDGEERRVASRLYAALEAGRRAALVRDGSTASGRRGVADDDGSATAAADVIETVRSALDSASRDEPHFRIDYIAVVDPEAFTPLDRAERGALLVAAARLGGVRLIDNLVIDGAAPTTTPHQALRRKDACQWTSA